MEFDSVISNPFLWSRVGSVGVVVQMGLDDVNADCWGLLLLREAKGDVDPANAAKPPDELIFRVDELRG